MRRLRCIWVFGCGGRPAHLKSSKPGLRLGSHTRLALAASFEQDTITICVHLTQACAPSPVEVVDESENSTCRRYILSRDWVLLRNLCFSHVIQHFALPDNKSARPLWWRCNRSGTIIINPRSPKVKTRVEALENCLLRSLRRSGSGPQTYLRVAHAAATSRQDGQTAKRAHSRIL
jgi:hypothetical protein